MVVESLRQDISYFEEKCRGPTTSQSFSHIRWLSTLSSCRIVSKLSIVLTSEQVRDPLSCISSTFSNLIPFSMSDQEELVPR